jgi:hypothetical protein
MLYMTVGKKEREREREREETGLAGATQWRDGGPGIPKCLPACLPLVCLLARAMDPGASKDENSFLKGTKSSSSLLSAALS